MAALFGGDIVSRRSVTDPHRPELSEVPAFSLADFSMMARQKRFDQLKELAATARIDAMQQQQRRLFPLFEEQQPISLQDLPNLENPFDESHTREFILSLAAVLFAVGLPMHVVEHYVVLVAHMLKQDVYILSLWQTMFIVRSFFGGRVFSGVVSFPVLCALTDIFS